LFTKPDNLQHGFLGKKKITKHLKILKVIVLFYAAISLWIAILK